MKALKATTVGTIAAGLGFALVITAAPLLAQPQGARAPRGGPGPDDAPPAWRTDGEFGRGPGGPMGGGPFARGPMMAGPGARGPMAGGPMGFGPMAGGPGEFGPHMEQFARFWDRPAIAERLELSENQIELLEQSLEQTKPIIQENAQAMREAGRKIAEAHRPGAEIDLDAVNQAIDELTAAQNATMKAAAAHRHTVHSLLLDEQLEQLQQIRQRQMRAAAASGLRGAAEQIRTHVRRIAADGVFSDEERERVEARLADAPEPMRERVIAAIENAVARVAAGENIEDLKEELIDIPEPPAPARTLPPLPPQPPRARR